MFTKTYLFPAKFLLTLKIFGYKLRVNKALKKTSKEPSFSLETRQIFSQFNRH